MQMSAGQHAVLRDLLQVLQLACALSCRRVASAVLVAQARGLLRQTHVAIEP